ncbi:MAG: hydroxymethylbilane synthase [Kineosporiaceae bacterium]
MSVSSPAAPAAGAARGVLRLGTRRSALATTQSRWVADRIEAAAASSGLDLRVELVEVTTHGDVTTAPLSSLGGTGVFVSALREALLRGDVDLAVHSLKDLPTGPADGLALAAVPEREDPRDVLVARGGLTFAARPDGSRIGTGSPRRAAQLLAAAREQGRSLVVVDVRGNVDTRLRLVAEGAVDAVVLARAGLLRLGREAEATDVLPAELMVPAPGQGALAVECRAGDATVLAALAPLDHEPTRLAVVAERALLAAVEAGCAAPLGAYALPGSGSGSGAARTLALEAVVAAPDGSRVLRRRIEGRAASPDPVADARALGVRLAGELLADGAAHLIARAAAAAGRPSAVPGASSSPRPDAAREGDL